MSTHAHVEAPAGEAPPTVLDVLFAPDRGMDRQARAGRALRYFLFAWLCSLLLGAALAYRVDARSSTLAKLDQNGELKSMSDRQIADETKSAERVAQVKSVAKGVVGAPVGLALACAALGVLSWFFRGRLKAGALLPVAAVTLVPSALADLLDAVAAYRHASLPPEGLPLSPRTLGAVLTAVGHAPMGSLAKLTNAFDFFSLWAAILMGCGLAAAAQMPKRRAIAGTLVAWVCYRLLTRVATGG